MEVDLHCAAEGARGQQRRGYAFEPFGLSKDCMQLTACVLFRSLALTTAACLRVHAAVQDAGRSGRAADSTSMLAVCALDAHRVPQSRTGRACRRGSSLAGR